MGVANKNYLVFLLLAFSQLLLAQTQSDIGVHSHNDYKQDRPFWLAFEQGSNSIEVDIFLKNDSLYVTHAGVEIVAGNTIEMAYLNPMKKAFSQSRNKERRLQLLIDIKSEAVATLNRLIGVLHSYDTLISNENITIAISGSRPERAKYLDYPDFILFDHQSLDDLKTEALWDKVALISLPFYKYSTWNGRQKMTDTEYDNLKDIVDQAHSFSKPFRFWATPDTELAWKTFESLGIDYINTDQPKECAQFFQAQKREHRK